MNTAPKKVAIASECDHPGRSPLPDRVCGVATRTRLEQTLVKRGYELATPDEADLVVPPCRAYAKDEELSVCTDGLHAVERKLVFALRKDVDGMVAKHLNRPVSGWISKSLMNTGVRPNQVTVFTMLLGIGSGFVVALGGWGAAVIGAGLLQAQSVLDGVDGELSRLKFQGSKLGEWLDTVSDDLSNLSFFAGVTYVASEAWVQTVGLAGMAIFAVMQLILYYLLATVYRSGNLQVFQWDVGSEGGLFARIEWMFKRDFFCLLFLVLALASQLQVAVVIFAAGAVISFVTLILQLVRRGPKL